MTFRIVAQGLVSRQVLIKRFNRNTMAKKAKTYSQVEATDALEQLGQRGTSAEEFIYELLRIFAGYGDGQIRRTKEGPGNAAKDGETILVKNLVAYRQTDMNDDDISKMYDVVNSMREDAKIIKHSPRLFVTSDGVHVVAYDPKENDWYENQIDLLWKDFEFFIPLAGIEKIQYTQEAEADVKSAELMAKLFDDIRRYNDIRDPKTVHALNIFMSRLLFCFFAEDTGLFPGENLFTSTLKTHTKEDGSDLAEFIDRAFLVMSTDDPETRSVLPKLYDVFPYVNGGLFKEQYPIPVLSRRARTLILNCGEYNWREINPDIFGSMIQAVVSPEQRAGLGMHYTSVPNIEKVIKPLFLDALEEEFAAACNETYEKVAKGLSHEKATVRLRKLLGRLSNIKFFDPACGSGNFLIISYKRLRDLEIRILCAMRDITHTPILALPSISLDQFYGIELDDYACDTAKLSLWLAEHQMNVKYHEEFHVQPDSLPLKKSGNIVCGNACRLDWNVVCPHDPEDEVYIMGNPPYVGSSLQSAEQKEDMQIAISSVCEGYKKLDYIASWFIKAALYSKGFKSSYAFVTTNSISQGEQVALLWPHILSDGIFINFCHTSFKWSNNAKLNAGVTCVIIGLCSNRTAQKFIYRQMSKNRASNINAYLFDAPNIFITSRRSAISDLPEMVIGSKPTDDGAFLISSSEIDSFRRDFPELHKLIKRFIGSDEFINDIPRYCLWVNDSEIDKYITNTEIQRRLQICKEMRLRSKKIPTQKLAETPWRFGEIRYKPTSSIIVPSVSSERREYIPIGFLNKDTVISNSAFAIYDAEKWLFALLTSKMHNLWVRAVGGSLETRIRYSNTLCYNTFPFPKLTPAEKEELERLAKKILDIRDENFDMTLGEMYNPESMPDELSEAHHQLDLAVERIYRAEPFTSDEERLEHLFKLYAKMIRK